MGLGLKLGDSVIFYAYSGRWDTLFELLNANINSQDFFTWYKNLFIENALRGLQIGVKWRVIRFLSQTHSILLQASNHCAKLNQNCSRRSAFRQNDSVTQSDFIICPMLCYSNGTDEGHESGWMDGWAGCVMWFIGHITELCKTVSLAASGLVVGVSKSKLCVVAYALLIVVVLFRYLTQWLIHDTLTPQSTQFNPSPPQLVLNGARSGPIISLAVHSYWTSV